MIISNVYRDDISAACKLLFQTLDLAESEAVGREDYEDADSILIARRRFGSIHLGYADFDSDDLLLAYFVCNRYFDLIGVDDAGDSKIAWYRVGDCLLGVELDEEDLAKLKSMLVGKE